MFCQKVLVFNQLSQIVTLKYLPEDPDEYGTMTAEVNPDPQAS
jgi:hypothetical protein